MDGIYADDKQNQKTNNKLKENIDKIHRQYRVDVLNIQGASKVAWNKSLSLYYYLLIIVPFSIPTTVNLLLSHPI